MKKLGLGAGFAVCTKSNARRPVNDGGAANSSWLVMKSGISPGVCWPSIQNMRTATSVKPSISKPLRLRAGLDSAGSKRNWKTSSFCWVKASKCVSLPTSVAPARSEKARPPAAPERLLRLVGCAGSLAGKKPRYRLAPSARVAWSGASES